VTINNVRDVFFRTPCTSTSIRNALWIHHTRVPVHKKNSPRLPAKVSLVFQNIFAAQKRKFKG